MQVHAFQLIQIVTEFACDLVCSKRLATQQVNLALALIGEAEAESSTPLPPPDRTASARFRAVFGAEHGPAQSGQAQKQPPAAAKTTAVRGLDSTFFGVLFFSSAFVGSAFFCFLPICLAKGLKDLPLF